MNKSISIGPIGCEFKRIQFFLNVDIETNINEINMPRSRKYQLIFQARKKALIILHSIIKKYTHASSLNLLL